MDQMRVRNRVTELAKRLHIATIPSNACWIDHAPCPYGEPGGRFDLRPPSFCRFPATPYGGTGCRRLAEVRHTETFDHLKMAEELVAEEGIPISDAVRRCAKRVQEVPEAEGILMVAADVLEEMDEEPRVCLESEKE